MHESNDQNQIHLPELLIKAHRQLHDALTASLRDANLSVDQWRLLETLSDKKGHTVGELAKSMVIKISGLSKNIDKLSARALLFRRQDDEDHRKINVFISDFGLDLVQECEQKTLDLHLALTEKLGARDSKSLDRLLRKLSN